MHQNSLRQYDHDGDDRRQELRRSEDQDLRNEVDALRFAVFGDKRAPETGLMERHIRLDAKVDRNHLRLETKIDRNTWALVSVALTLAGSIVQRMVG